MSSPAKPKRANFLDLTFDCLNQEEALCAVIQLALGPAFSYVVTPNVDHVVRLHRDATGTGLRQSYRRASLCLCDSRILQGLARLSGTRLEVVPGSDLTASLLQNHARSFPRVAIIGGDIELVQRLSSRYSSVEWLHHAPPMEVRTDRLAQIAIIDFVENCSADLFFFAIGSPQSELISGEIARRRNATGVALCIGASLEFLTGAKKRAPIWMQKAALEWLFRLCTEPRRLWRRYMIEGPAVFRIWWAWHFKPARPPAAFGSNGTDET